ncbi:MAG TPA: NnrS family protein [Nitrospira sp.]|nr:NnrS family protein [Nitrospira sp.]
MTDRSTELRVVPLHPAPAVADDEPTFPAYEGPAILSYGFRPFFLAASLFAGLAVPLWVLWYGTGDSPAFLYPAREWHVHEMLFGFLPAVMAGFLLTAAPNWTGRVPLRGAPLCLLVLLWSGGRLFVAWPGPLPLVAAAIDGLFLIVLAGFLWRQLLAARTWAHTPIAAIISLYALANLWFHQAALRGAATDGPERLVLSLVILLLTLIGGRVTPNFSREFLASRRPGSLPPVFSRVDALSVVAVLAAVVAWMLAPDSRLAGGSFLAAGAVNLVRLMRWRGWLTAEEPLVLVLHLGYAWLVLSLLALGMSQLGWGLAANAVHVLTTGAVGTMTLGVMTRASLGHTGRVKHAGPVTVLMYGLVTVGALLRVFVSGSDTAAGWAVGMLGAAAAAWSGAYVLFAVAYGPFLLRPSLDE